MTKVYCLETAVSTVYDCMRVIGIASYTRDLAPLERLMRDTMVFPLYDGNQGVRRRQLHDILRQPGYDSMLAARGAISLAAAMAANLAERKRDDDPSAAPGARPGPSEEPQPAYADGSGALAGQAISECSDGGLPPRLGR